jgi:hypothetical protein
VFGRNAYPHLPSRVFATRLARSGVAAIVLVALSLGIGALGYHACAACSWIDAVHAAAMILTGMGPALEMPTPAGKLFETCYALFSGIMFLFVATLLLAPVAHRVLHRFHLEGKERE